MIHLLTIALSVFVTPALADRNELDLGGTPLRWTAPVTDQWQAIRRDRPRSQGPKAIIGAPLRTTRMRPGRVFAQSVGQARHHSPFFVIGDDPLSLKWLQARKERLIEMGALAVIVSVPSPERLEYLRSRLAPLDSQLLSGDALAMHLNLDRYPVLIHQGEAMQ